MATLPNPSRSRRSRICSRIVLLVVAAATSLGHWGAVCASETEPERRQAARRQAARRRAEEFFESRVRPVLVDRCFDCHGPDASEGELRMDSLAGLLRGGSRGPAIVPGKPEESLAIRAVRHGELLKMPPKTKLPASEIAALAKWVSAGAKWPNSPEANAPAVDFKPTDDASDSAISESAATTESDFWAFQPIANPRLPTVRSGQYVQSPIDAFVLARLETVGLKPARRADRRTLIRRATFNLLGLPPTVDEVREFLDDDRPGAFARVVDRLLASPHYGERWGRHWLDVARYADSNGLDENLAYANAFRYRDYVVSAFNRDMRLDRFIQEQIAGDLLPAKDPESASRQMVATGFLCIGPKMLAEDDPVKLRMDIVDEQVDTVGRAFMGMTLGCARCHDHKFDPVTIRDYYGLAGIFHSTRTMDTFTVVARWHEHPLATKQAVAERDAHQQKIADARQEYVDRRAGLVQPLLDEARRHVGDYLLAAERTIRREKQLAALRPLGPQVQAGKRGDALLLEAEAFDRGNVLRDTTNYGKGIGVLVNQGATPNFVEYDIQLPRDGAYRLEVRYAAAGSRPCRLYIDGRLLQDRVADGVTGSWFPDKQTWEVEGVYELTAGAHVLRLEQSQFFPHIDKLLLVPCDAKTARINALPWLDAQYEPLPPLVARWVKILRADAKNDASALSPWIALTAKNGPPLHLRLLAETYENLARPASDTPASDTPASSGDVPEADANQITPKQQAEFRQLLVADEGPFRDTDDLDAFFDRSDRAALTALKTIKERIAKSLPEFPSAMVVAEDAASDLRLHYRGSHLTLGPVVNRTLPAVLSPRETAARIEQGSGRLELARWLTSPGHPLTARVLANRVWLWHFGKGLVRTPDNFGRLGDRPTHPHLLDWLATRLIHHHWRLKELHREIMLSSTWRVSTEFDAAAAERDPENRLLWRANRRRLDAESVRDGLLATAGNLDRRMGGTLLPTANRKYVTSTANVDPVVYVSNRRSLYLPIVRSALYEVFQAFDFADPSALSGKRQTTTVAPQALFMMNSPFVAQQTQRLADKLLGQASPEETLESDRDRVKQLYLTVYGRPARNHEIERAIGFVGVYQRRAAEEPRSNPSETRRRAWQSLCRAVLAANEFMYVE